MSGGVPIRSDGRACYGRGDDLCQSIDLGFQHRIPPVCENPNRMLPS